MGCGDRVFGPGTSHKQFIVVQMMRPSALGEPLLRPRFYFLGAREDVAAFSQEKAVNVAQTMWKALECHCGPLAELQNRFLPLTPKAQGFPNSRGTKWQSLRKEWEEVNCKMECKMEIKVESPDCTADTLFLHLPRERDVWDKLQRTVGEADELTCDLSQSLGRNRVQVRGRLGTITPGAHLIV